MKSPASIGFQHIVQWVFSLLGFIPYLLAIYIMMRINANVTESVLLIAAAVLLSQLAGFAMMRRFGSQLQELSQKTARAVITTQKTPIEMNGDTPQELSDLARHFNTMLSQVEKSNRNYREVTTKLMLYARDIESYQKKLKEEALIRHRLGRYVGKNVLDQIVLTGTDMPIQNKKQVATVLFADIRSFTAISERMSPENVIAMLNRYFDAMSDIVFEHDGILDKFVGDELMAVFGLIGAAEEAPLNAVRAAIAMQNRVGDLMQSVDGRNWPAFEIGIGINTGHVVVGNVGSKNHMDYTVIGDTVNVAARLEQMAEERAIIIGEETHKHCAPYVRMEAKGEIKVRNRTRPVKCYQILTGPGSVK